MEDPALVKENLKLLLEGTFRSQDFWSVVGPPLGHEENQEIVWAWVQSDYDQILKTMGNKTSRRLPVVIRGTCEEEGLKERLAFFQGEKLPDGADRHLKLAEESVRQCIRFRAVHAESFRAFLKK